MKNTSSVDRAKVHAELIAAYGPLCTREHFADYVAKGGVDPRWLYYTAEARAQYRVGRGQYRVPGPGGQVVPVTSAPPAVRSASKMVHVPKSAPAAVPAPAAPLTADEPTSVNTSLALHVNDKTPKADILAQITSLAQSDSALCVIPKKNAAFVPFGDFDVIRTIVKARTFHPIFITGLSGNGKTFGIAQACALEGREHVRINITAETDEDDLLGGFRLRDGQTVFELGPIVVAMIRGAVCTIDEIDLAGPKIMCLQSIMEGNGVTLKKIGVHVAPSAGFTVFATANTKGRGSADGKFVGTNFLNEAFLERFPITIEQPYPSIAVEKKILTKTYAQGGGTLTPEAETFFETLAKWAEAIRVTYFEDGIDDLISTRRLVHIVRTYQIFHNADRALALCLNRFETDTRLKFLDLFAKMSPETAQPAAAAPVTSGVVTDDDVPF